MQVEVKKVYNGCVDVRDYDVKKCLSLNESCKVYHRGDIMTLSVDQLNNEIKAMSKPIPSKFNGPDYKLISYSWNPDEIEF